MQKSNKYSKKLILLSSLFLAFLGYSNKYNVLNIESGTIHKLQKNTNKFSELNIKQNAVLEIEGEKTIQLEKSVLDKFVNNAGTINMLKPNIKLFIFGPYKGDNGIIKINKNALFVLEEYDEDEGKHTNFGNTQIFFLDEKGENIQIDKSITELASEKFPVVVYVHSTSKNNNAFVGKINTMSASEIQLYFDDNKRQIDENGRRYNIYSFTPITINENKQPILSQTVPAYVMMPKSNVDLTYESLRPHKKDSGDLWVRVLGSYNKTQGTDRFSMNSKSGGIQIGKNFNILGAYLSYQHNKVNFYDKYRAENGRVVSDKNTGYTNTDAYSLGLTATKYTKNGMYLDAIGQITLLNNKYNARDGIKTNNSGVNLAISGEVGKTFKLSDDLYLEPQAQLIYQRLSLKDFTDGYRKVTQDKTNNIRARLGAKLSYKDRYYGKVNLWHNAINSSKVNIGKDVFEEKYNKNSIELGVGMKKEVFEKATIHADILYNKSIGKAKNDTVKITIAIDYKSLWFAQ